MVTGDTDKIKTIMSQRKKPNELVKELNLLRIEGAILLERLVFLEQELQRIIYLQESVLGGFIWSAGRDSRGDQLS